MTIDNLTPARRTAIALVMLGTVIGLGLLVVEMSTLVNTVGAGKIAGMGVVTGILLMLGFQHLGLVAALEAKERTGGVALLLIGVAAGATAAISHLNHTGGHDAPPEAVAVLEKQFKERSSKSPPQWKLKVRYREQAKLIDVTEAEWNPVEPGQTYSARVIEGAFGYPVLSCPAPCR